MSNPVTRRAFAAALGAGAVAGTGTAADDEGPKPTEAAFTRDYPPPKFKPSWKRQQINRAFVQDFVIYAHSELDLVKKLLEKEPALLHATMDWGAGDWESGLGAAAHMGRRDIAEVLLDRGARIDIFAAAMLGQLDVVKGLLAVYPKLIDAKGPHGIGLHSHAKAGGKQAVPVLEYLQTVKAVDLTPKKPATEVKKP